jgi:NADH:ubiquinone oxidoreductase subunit 6 (subunit J)
MNPFPASSIILTVVFLMCLGVMAAGALIAVLSSRLIRSVCGLAICCIGLAGLYYFLHSPFLAVMEILIYVGAVCVTIVFAIMLAEPDEPAADTRTESLLWASGSFVAAAAIFCGLAWLGTHNHWPRTDGPAGDWSVAAIGRALLTTYSMAFELISLALLVAIVGALAIAKTGRAKAER